MKKIVKTMFIITVIAVITLPIILVILLWTKISSNEPMIRALQEKVNYLESRVTELEKLEELDEKLSNLESFEGEESTKENEADEGNEIAYGKSELRSLQELIDSENPEDWIKAASHSEATEEQLRNIASKAAGLDYPRYTNEEDKKTQLKIANELLANPSTTEKVLEEFENSRFDEVRKIGRQTSIEAMIESEVPEDWLEVAKRSEATEEQLRIIAKKTANMNYPKYTNDKDKQM